MYNLLLISGGVTFLFFIISWIVFYQMSVRFIESEIVKEGGILPPRRPIGSIAVHYAMVLLLPVNIIHRQAFVDGVSARRLSRKKDRILAIILFISSILYIVASTFFYFLYDTE
ncbi:hypothetical protein AKG98_2657 [Moritella sp. JT01]|uniref:hypothetical protein n=1 Tax=Moritella sp. JT01 TaxID=756698 RepID=UPI000799E4EF|nr:hypothetical protein [Moritella sp. JT01]KXO07089.1 hypothetical protein AKG98_2657 [Moritella sp. JT01]